MSHTVPAKTRVEVRDGRVHLLMRGVEEESELDLAFTPERAREVAAELVRAADEAEG